MQKIFYSFAITTIGSIIAYIVHDPKFGMDDANITLNYAENIANGYGYVYFIGGEKVEGSTSLIWTLINALFFKFLDSPELFISIFSFFLTTIIVYQVLFFSNVLSEKLSLNLNTSNLLISFLFIVNPIFFTWQVWSMMDIAIWVLVFTLISLNILLLVIDQSIFIKNKSKQYVLFVGLLILPLIRPEGLSISIGLCFLIFLYSLLEDKLKLKKKIIITLISIIILTTIITIIRMEYFGYPFPNTFYAKVSTSYIYQFLWGIKYLIRHLLESYYFFILLTSFIGLLYMYTKKILKIYNYKCFIVFFISLIFGIFFQYVALGGDSFNGSRHFQILTPMLVGFSAVVLNLFFSKINLFDKKLGIIEKNTTNSLVFTLLFGLFFLPGLSNYIYYGGKVNNDFRMAEKQRYVGKILNKLPNTPSVGVYIAGGFSMTYKGNIYDMMGLNWTKMAHANRKHNKNSLKNHSAFDKTVLFQTKPDILFPAINNHDCKNLKRDEWRDAVLVGLFDDPRFSNIYITGCFEDVRFYVKKVYYNNFKQIITKGY